MTEIAPGTPLGPCPFTGREPTQPIQQPNGDWRIWAGDYHLTRPTRELVVKAWNTRAPDPALLAKAEALAVALEAERLWHAGRISAAETIRDGMDRHYTQKQHGERAEVIDAALAAYRGDDGICPELPDEMP